MALSPVRSDKNFSGRAGKIPGKKVTSRDARDVLRKGRERGGKIVLVFCRS